MAKSNAAPPARYHPWLAGLHWLLAVLIFGNLGAGWLLLESLDPADPARLGALRAHVAVGLIVLVLMLVRLGMRIFSRRPPPVEGAKVLRWSAAVVHWGFYVLVFGMTTSGLGLALASGLFEAFKGAGPVPADFSRYPPLAGHALFATILGGFIGLHLAAALFHQFIRRDGLIGRMGFGPRYAPSAKEPSQ